VLLFAGAQLLNRNDKANEVAARTEKNTPAPSTNNKQPAVADSNGSNGAIITANPPSAIAESPSKKPIFVSPDDLSNYYDKKFGEVEPLKKEDLSIAGTKGKESTVAQPQKDFEFTPAEPVLERARLDSARPKTIQNAAPVREQGRYYDLNTAPPTASANKPKEETNFSFQKRRQTESDNIQQAKQEATAQQNNGSFNNTAVNAPDNGVFNNVRGNNVNTNNFSNGVTSNNAATLQNGLYLNPSPARSFNFNYRITDALGNTVPFTNISIPADNLVTYARADGSFGLESTDSVLTVNLRAAGFQQQAFKLRYNTNAGNLVLQDDKTAASNLVVVGEQKNYALKKKSGMLKSVVEEVEPSDGWASYDSYLANNINTTDKPKGEVELTFSVNKKGEPTDVKVNKSLSEAADQEAIRLLTQGPRWKGKKKKKSKGTVVVTF
jgi:hypothetical protein